MRSRETAIARTVQIDGQNSRLSRKLKSLDNPQLAGRPSIFMSCYPVMWEMERNWLTGNEKYPVPMGESSGADLVEDEAKPSQTGLPTGDLALTGLFSIR